MHRPKSNPGVFPVCMFSAPSWGLQHNWGWGRASPLSYRLRVPHHQPRKPRCRHPQPGAVHQATWQLRYGSSSTDGGLGMWLCFSFETRLLIYTFHVSVIFTTNLLSDLIPSKVCAPIRHQGTETGCRAMPAAVLAGLVSLGGLCAVRCQVFPIK